MWITQCCCMSSLSWQENIICYANEIPRKFRSNYDVVVAVNCCNGLATNDYNLPCCSVAMAKCKSNGHCVWDSWHQFVNSGNMFVRYTFFVKSQHPKKFVWLLFLGFNNRIWSLKTKATPTFMNVVIWQKSISNVYTTIPRF